MTGARHREDLQAACGATHQAESPASPVPDFQEAAVPPPCTDVVEDALTQLAGILAAAYLRLLAHREEPRHGDRTGDNPSILLDSRCQQSDELDGQVPRMRPPCKQT